MYGIRFLQMAARLAYMRGTYYEPDLVEAWMLLHYFGLVPIGETTVCPREAIPASYEFHDILKRAAVGIEKL